MLPRWRNIEFSSRGLLFQQKKGFTVLVSWNILEVPPRCHPIGIKSPEPGWQEICATSRTYWTLLWDNEPIGWDWPSCLPAAAVCLRGLDVYSGRARSWLRIPRATPKLNDRQHPRLPCNCHRSPLIISLPLKDPSTFPSKVLSVFSVIETQVGCYWNPEEPLHGCILHPNPSSLGFPVLWPESHESLWFFFL